MEWNKKNVRNCILVIFAGILFFTLLQHLNIVGKVISGIFKLIFPFLLGGAIAFVLNVPMRAIERNLFKKSKGKKGPRILSLIITLLLFAAVVTLAVFVIVPGIVDAVKSIIAQVPAALQRLEEWSIQIEEYIPRLEKYLKSLELNWGDISSKIISVLKDFGTSVLSASGGFIGGVVSGIGTFLIAFVFAIYILLQKERLGSHVRQITYALLPEARGDKFLSVVKLSDQTFSKFLSGQCVEACILGSMFVVCMSILQMPYALLIGFLITITALIPIIGAFIGCIVGALLIAITSPVQALIFVIMFLVLQQIEGNLIYPHVVGNSVGLPSIWVLVAVALGGKLMGVAGILLFIPLCSVCYSLFRTFVKNRLKKKAVPEEKWIAKTPIAVPKTERKNKTDKKTKRSGIFSRKSKASKDPEIVTEGKETDDCKGDGPSA